MSRFEVQNEVKHPESFGGGWQLCFQAGTYHHDDGEIETGFRFIWRDPAGKMRPQRGQARIPSREHLEHLTSLAEREGWY